MVWKIRPNPLRSLFCTVRKILFIISYMNLIYKRFYSSGPPLVMQRHSGWTTGSKIMAASAGFVLITGRKWISLVVLFCNPFFIVRHYFDPFDNELYSGYRNVSANRFYNFGYFVHHCWADAGLSVGVKCIWSPACQRTAPICKHKKFLHFAKLRILFFQEEILAESSAVSRNGPGRAGRLNRRQLAVEYLFGSSSRPLLGGRSNRRRRYVI